ncbi:M6 family metalloprotease domain-containing protein [Vibrio sp. OCN044]|uniref:M6 family metalloprotease domain-containing protein n=1 Tax=Vibrio tetraodonis subsp. pristinus TaxID=2695891 RepID=A0A6L8LS69_9VIBR|nr:immune inhibitor A domain-containing protein [Vibrio tetraodonis]MYM58931.1 M6 family metalloprotease domain-containing protein [Vibrio tetraodonis subsp. pristinus]
MACIRKTLLATAVMALFSASGNAKTPIDLGVINEEKIIEMLERKGILDENSSVEEQKLALNNYLNKKLGNNFQGDAQFGKKALAQRAKILKSIETNKGPHKAHVFAFDLSDKRTDKVLAVLVDFPDLPWNENRLTSEHTDMLYDSYQPEHYQSLLFSDTGYTGPNGENLISMRQYYESESGKSYSVAGQAAGWYRASKEAAFYGGNSPSTDNDLNAQELVREALNQLAQDPSINLADYDIEDRYDYDQDGDYREPDGVIDHLMVFHSSVGEEAGGGVLKDDAIWSHRYNLGKYHVLQGTSSTVPSRFGGSYAAFDYTIQPIDAAAGVCAHEYGHDLGLPDEYDTQYTGKGEPVSYWSIMSSGSWAGKIGGTQPTAFSSWAKQYLQESIGGKWLINQTISVDDLTDEGEEITLHQTIDNDKQNMVRIDLPIKRTTGQKPYSGSYGFHSGKGDDLKNSMSREVALPEATNIKLVFKAWYQIEKDYDFARVLINDQQIAGSITTLDDPNTTDLVPAISGESDGWVDAEFDLSNWSGQTITLGFDYITDGGLAMEGLHIDNIEIIADGVATLIDDGEAESSFALNGYRLNNGFNESPHYYLLQWRSHNDVDEGLNNIKRFGSLMSFEPGLIVWYVDNSMTDNWVGQHPGEGWLGVVDADQNAMIWENSGSAAQTRYQLRDASFSLQDQAPMTLENKEGDILRDVSLLGNAYFADNEDYSNPQAPDAGRLLAEHGVAIEVIEQAADNTYGVIRVSKTPEPNQLPIAAFSLTVDGMTVTASNMSSDPDGSIVDYLWDFGNGETSKEASPNWTYLNDGRYTVSLTVTDDRGDQHTTTETIFAEDDNILPEATAKYIHLGRLVTMWSTSTDDDGRIVDTEWILPNGDIKRGRMFTALFPSYGEHQVRLTVMDDKGDKVSTLIDVEL